MDHEAVAGDMDARVEAYARALIGSAAQIRLPELFTQRNDALYLELDRNGVSTAVLGTGSLTDDEVDKLLEYRLAQYVVLGHVDAKQIYKDQLIRESRSSIAPGDVHVVAGAADTGEILCYLALRSVAAPPSVTLRTTVRPLFPLEEIHGWGVLNRLHILPDLPLGKIRELSRFVKNQQLDRLDERLIRAPVEMGVALFRALASLSGEVQALVGEIEESVALRNLDFFHHPTVVVHGTLPFMNEDSYGRPHFEQSVCYPFAVLVEDLMHSRARHEEVERALALPGKAGLQALLALKQDARAPDSSLRPPTGLPVLTDTALPQREVPMAVRRDMLALGERLRTTELLSSLTPAEATVLGTFMQRVEVPSGHLVVRQGDEGDDLFLIETGEAEVRFTSAPGRSDVIATRGPGDHIGEIALLNGGERTADVVALTPMSLLRLSQEAYRHYLRHMIEVEQQLETTAAARSATVGNTVVRTL